MGLATKKSPFLILLSSLVTAAAQLRSSSIHESAHARGALIPGRVPHRPAVILREGSARARACP
jgi:hypothetical protein